MQSASTIKTKFCTLILLDGLFSGSILALLLWLDIPPQLYFAFSWISFGVLALLSLVFLRHASRRSFILLTALASTSLIYLFPQLFGPACNGMPIALAGQPGCTRECDEDCYRWDQDGQCSASKKNCWIECPADQPPSISASVACDQWGQNGWCVGNETLYLTASDPQGQTLQISGDIAGNPFACPNGPTCSFSLSNGSGAINYLVRSMTTLTASGSTSWALDNTSPQINGSLNGTAGNNNWFISNTMVSASTADPSTGSGQAGSGLAVFEYSLDSAAYTAYTAPITLSNGAHTLIFHAVDLAGNQNATTQSINVDTITPIMDLSLTGTSGSNGWYASNVQVTASANDPSTLPSVAGQAGSGLASLEYTLDGGAWTSYIGTLTLTDGAHSLSVRAQDAAGNITQSDQQIHVDTTTPLIELSVNGTQGAAGWYVSDIQVIGVGSDSGSGLASFEYAVDGGVWTAYTGPLPYAEGQRSVQFRATDQAGNMTVTPAQAYQVDTSTPSLNLALSGAPGTNGWYRSNVQATTSANDSVSSLALLEYAIDGGAWTTYTSAPTLADGIHTLSLRAFDVAGNVIQKDQKVYVDAVTPLIKLSVNGTQGAGGWYISYIQVNASASDGGSGILSFEYALDNGAWTPYINPLPYAEGQYRLKFRAIDNAGNVTITPAQDLWVDTTLPEIQMPDTLKPGVTANYKVLDAGSGVGGTRVVIHDGQERYPKVTWGDGELVASFTGDIFWDGRFANGTVAPVGDYFVTIKAHDQAGNESMQTAIIAVENSLLTYLIPRYVPPSVMTPILPTTPPAVPPTDANFGGETNTEPADPQSDTLTPGHVTESQPVNVPISQTTNILWGAIAAAALGAVTADAIRKKQKQGVASSFGGEANHSVSADSQTDTITSGGLTVAAGAAGVEEFSASPVTKLPVTNPPTSVILWGTTAAEAIGAFAAKAEAAANAVRRAVRSGGDEGGGGMTYKQIGRAYQASLNNFKTTLDLAKALGLSPEKAKALQDQVAQTGKIGKSLNMAQSHVNYATRPKNDLEAEETSWLEQSEEERALKGLQERATAAAAEAVVATQICTPENTRELKWWEKAWNGALKHQTELSLGTGIVVGAAAVALVVTGVITAPVWAIAGAVLATAALVTAGTVALNAHFGLGLGSNLRSNLLAGTAAAFLTTGAGLLLASAAPWVSTTIAGTCAKYPNACSQIMPILDYGEEALLSGQVAYFTWMGDQDKAAEAVLELQLEQMDGGVPGNAVAAELGEQLSKLGDDVPELIATYGDEIVPLLLQYGDDAVDIIGTYGHEGIALLLKYGDKTDDAIALVKEFGTPAVKLLDIVDLTSADKLLKTLDDDVLDYAMKQDSDAVFALSRWSEKELKEFGPELALRAKNDATVLKAIKDLVESGPIDPKYLTAKQEDLIKVIAENSMQYADEGQIVLGKWVDYGNGFTSYARETGSVHYNPHPDMWNLLGDLGDKRDGTAWLVNKEVIQIGVERGLPFEYTLNGLPSDALEFEESAIEKIWEGGSSTEMIYDNVKESLGIDYIPVHTKELVELYSAGYVYSFDSITNSYILIKP